MAKSWYAWTDIQHGKDGERQVLRRGETVTASKLGIEDDEFEQLKESRAIRQTKYPDMPSDYTGSPREFILEERTRQLADIEDNFDLADLQLAATREADGEVDEMPEDEEKE